MVPGVFLSACQPGPAFPDIAAGRSSGLLFNPAGVELIGNKGIKFIINVFMASGHENQMPPEKTTGRAAGRLIVGTDSLYSLFFPKIS